jgi:hypothetical protein
LGKLLHTSMNNCYIYKHITKNMPDGKEPYVYYGKGTGNRARDKSKRHEFWKRVFTKYEYDIIILHENLTDEEAFKLEREIIAEAKKNNENLVNILSGGEGLTSAEAKDLYEKYCNNSEWLRKSAEAHKKLSQDPEWRRKQKEGAKKRSQDAEWLRKNAERSKKLAQDPEWRKNHMQAIEGFKKEYDFVSPDGIIHHIRGLRQFCKDNNLNHGHMHSVYKGKLNHHKGWKKYTPPEDLHNTFFDFK